MLRRQEIKDVKCGLPVGRKERMISGLDGSIISLKKVEHKKLNTNENITRYHLYAPSSVLFFNPN